MPAWKSSHVAGDESSTRWASSNVIRCQTHKQGWDLQGVVLISIHSNFRVEVVTGLNRAFLSGEYFNVATPKRD
ncbi:hypothetical protein TNCV_1115311 [Trichonephila clavipes]|nr:hypothetical protein TNCV_1115311 [Trichonephila clavipes]